MKVVRQQLHVARNETTQPREYSAAGEHGALANRGVLGALALANVWLAVTFWTKAIAPDHSIQQRDVWSIIAANGERIGQGTLGAALTLGEIFALVWASAALARREYVKGAVAVAVWAVALVANFTPELSTVATMFGNGTYSAAHAAAQWDATNQEITRDRAEVTRLQAEFDKLGVTGAAAGLREQADSLTAANEERERRGLLPRVSDIRRAGELGNAASVAAQLEQAKRDLRDAESRQQTQGAVRPEAAAPINQATADLFNAARHMFGMRGPDLTPVQALLIQAFATALALKMFCTFGFWITTDQSVRRGETRGGAAPRTPQLAVVKREEIPAMFAASANGLEFGRKLNQALYLLARGDKTPFALIDRADPDAPAIGLRNALGISEPELLKFMALDRDKLPSVDEARAYAHRLANPPRRGLSALFGKRALG